MSVSEEPLKCVPMADPEAERIPNFHGAEPLAPISRLDCLRLNDTNGKDTFLKY